MEERYWERAYSRSPIHVVCDVTVAILTKNTWTGWVLNVTYHGFIMALHYATLQELLFVISNNIQR